MERFTDSVNDLTPAETAQLSEFLGWLSKDGPHERERFVAFVMGLDRNRHRKYPERNQERLEPGDARKNDGSASTARQLQEGEPQKAVAAMAGRYGYGDQDLWWNRRQ